MAFDVNGARAAGWTDPEILAFMRKPLRLARGLTTPGDWSPVGRAPAPAAPFVGPPTPMNAPPPESTFQGTMQRIEAPSYSGPQYMGGPLQIGQPPDVGNLIGGIENVQGYGPQRAQGVSELGRFGMEAASPLLGPAAAARPLSTLMGLGYGMAAQHGVESGLTSLGVQPGYAQLAGDVAGLGAGVATGLAPWERFAKPGAFPEFVRNELGEIVIRPSQGWTSTLRDLIEQKVPAKVQPAQLRGILGQASPEEVKWSGMGETLSGIPASLEQMRIDRPTVLSQIKQPQIEEVLRTPPDTKFSQWAFPGGTDYNELLLTMPSLKGGTYQSPHWNEPNVLAHARYGGYLSPEGKRVMMAHEFQSDLHQAGREKGYVDPKVSEKLYQEYLNAEGQGNIAYEKWRQETGEPRTDELLRDIPTGSDRTLPSYKEYIRLAEKSNELYDQWVNASQGLPDAPFKKDWHELLMKRMLGEAVEKGYDKLAWTTGEQQAERYGLEKQFSRIEYDPVNGKLYADDPTGKTIVNERADMHDLDQYIGREPAKRLRAKVAEWEGPEKPIPFIEGPDMKFGGEGMKGFYDKILPDFARSYGKQFGANVSQTQIQTPEGPKTVWSLDITPEMATALKGGQPMFGRKIAKPKK